MLLGGIRTHDPCNSRAVSYQLPRLSGKVSGDIHLLKQVSFLECLECVYQVSINYVIIIIIILRPALMKWCQVALLSLVWIEICVSGDGVRVAHFPPAAIWMSARRIPEDQMRYRLIRCSQTVASKLETSLHYGIRKWWSIAINLPVCSKVPPVDVENSTQQLSVATVDAIILFLCCCPCFGSI